MRAISNAILICPNSLVARYWAIEECQKIDNNDKTNLFNLSSENIGC